MPGSDGPISRAVQKCTVARGASCLVLAAVLIALCAGCDTSSGVAQEPEATTSGPEARAGHAANAAQFVPPAIHVDELDAPAAVVVDDSPVAADEDTSQQPERVPGEPAAEEGKPKDQPSSATDNEAGNDTPRYETREIHDPNGVGKFYMGREIAQVMGFAFGGVEWLERVEREKEESLSKLVKALNLKPGMVVADIGAGSGVISFLMAPKVGKTGKVLAVDVQQEMLDRLKARARIRKITNVETILGTEKSPELEEASVDLALMVDVYHEFEYPYEMMVEISKAMKPGGRVVFVEYRMEDPDVMIKLVHKMTEAQVKKEIGLPEFGLKWKETIGVLPLQHIIVFEKQAPADGKAS